MPGNYKVVYKTNLSGDTWRVLADNLSTQQLYVLDASPAALGLASNEYVTQFMVSFGVVPANFRQVEAPRVYCNVVSWATGGSQFTNQADTGGVYDGQWIMGHQPVGDQGLQAIQSPAPHRLLRLTAEDK